MKNKRPVAFIILIIISSFLFFFQMTGILFLIPSIWIAGLLAILGIVIFYSSFIKEDNFGITCGTGMFTSSIVVFVSTQLQMLSYVNYLFPSLIFIAAISYLMIYLSNREKNQHLFISLLIFFAAYLSLTTFNKIGIVQMGNRVLFYILDFWPSVIFIISLIFLIRKRHVQE